MNTITSLVTGTSYFTIGSESFEGLGTARAAAVIVAYVSSTYYILLYFFAGTQSFA